MKKLFVLSNTSFYAFIMVICFFHLWYFHEMMQTIPRIPFKILTSIIFFYIFLLYLIKDLRENLNIVVIIMGIFIGYLILYNVIHYSSYTILNFQMTNKILFDNLGYIYSYIIYFLIGFYYKGYSKHKKIIYIIYTILTINALFFVNLNTYSLDITRANLDLFGIYLFLGDTYAIFALLTIVITPSRRLQFLLFLISLPILYILMSRTSLYIFVLTIIIYLIITNVRALFIAFILFVALFLLISIVDSELIEKLINSRMLGFLFGDADRSVNAREAFMTIGLSGIENHWFIGDFSGDVVYYNDTGHYIHNYLGLLRQYGIFAFTLFFILILFGLKEIFVWSLQRNKYSRDYEVFIVLFIFLFIEIVLSRAISFPYIFFGIGIVAGLQKDRSWIISSSR